MIVMYKHFDRIVVSRSIHLGRAENYYLLSLVCKESSGS